VIEQLYANRIRFATETAVGSGVASGDWVSPPCTAAAITRQFRQVVARKDVFRQPRGRKIVSESWLLRTAHEIGLPFFRWVLLPHMVNRGGGVWTLDPEAEGPTFVLEGETEQGRRMRVAGIKLSEVMLIFEDMRLVRMECQWVGLWRDVPETELPDATEDVRGTILPTWQAQAVATTGAWDTNPRATQRVNAAGAQLFLSRGIEACNYGADGIPTQHNRKAWNVVGETYLPETEGITDVAFLDDWQGRLGFFFGTGDEQLRINNAQGFVGEDDLKAYDFRMRRLVFQSFTDDRRATLEFRE